MCISQSGVFSGLNLAYFSISRLRLEVESSTGSRMAQTVLDKREDYNYLLTTILWGNVGINVLLTLLTDSVMTGLGAFLFSTVAITLFGEILPQAYFSRHALVVGYYLSPLMTFYQYLLYPVSKPSSMVLDYLLGKEAFHYFREPDLKEFIREHMDAHQTDIGRIEGIGALNFLTIDDLEVAGTGVLLDPESVIALPEERNEVQFPKISEGVGDPFIQKLLQPDKKWIVLTDQSNEPQYLLNKLRFLTDFLKGEDETRLEEYCHEPVIIRNRERVLGKVLNQMIEDDSPGSSIHQDVILLWDDPPKIVTGSDILRRLLRGTKIFGL